MIFFVTRKKQKKTETWREREKDREGVMVQIKIQRQINRTDVRDEQRKRELHVMIFQREAEKEDKQRTEKDTDK